MKIYTKVVIDMNTNEVLEEESYKYKGDVEFALGGGGGGQPQTNSDPWGGVQPYLTGTGGSPATKGHYKGIGRDRTWVEGTPATEGTTGIYPEARRLYDKGTQYFPGNTVAGFTDPQAQAQAMQIARATGGSDLVRNAQGNVGQTAGGAFLGGNPINQYAGGIASGNAGQAGQLRQDIGQVATGQGSPAEGYLNTMAQGGTNPYLDQMYEHATNKATRAFTEGVLPQIKSSASGAGRYGSPAMQRQIDTAAGQFGESLTGMAANMYGGQYNADMNRQLQAAQGLGGLSAQNTGQQLQAANMLANQGSSDIGQQLQATGLMGQAYGGERNRMLQASGMAPALANQDYFDISKLSEVGGQQQGMNQRLIDEQKAKFDYGQNSPWQNLSRYQSLLTGGVPMSSQSFTPQSRGSDMGGLASGAMLGAGVGGMMTTGGMPALAAGAGMAGFAPWLAGGAALGLLGNRM